MSDFRYSRLMEVKEKLLEKKQEELEAALAAVEAVTTEIETTESQIVCTYSEMTTRCLYGKELSTLIDHVAFLDKKKLALVEERKNREAHVEKLRKDLIDLEIDIKMLEKLKSRILTTVRKAKNKKDQKLMDELALRIEERQP
jgi:flagellar export protein FliJ